MPLSISTIYCPKFDFGQYVCCLLSKLSHKFLECSIHTDNLPDCFLHFFTLNLLILLSLYLCLPGNFEISIFGCQMQRCKSFLCCCCQGCFMFKKNWSHFFLALKLRRKKISQKRIFFTYRISANSFRHWIVSSLE